MNNRSRDWVIDKLLFPLALDTDLAKVKKVFKKIGQDLLADPELGRFLLEPVKSQGVFEIEDSAIIVRAKFKSLPGRQFLIRRVVFERAQQAFQQEGICFARRGVAVAGPREIPPTGEERGRPATPAEGAMPDEKRTAAGS